MDHDKVIDKIKKCLALAESTNKHEANQAKKHADALMRKYKISVQEIENSDIKQVSNHKSYPNSHWRIMLVQTVSKAFLAIPINQKSTITWHSRGNSAELAEYVFEFLYHKCKIARAEYIKSDLKRVRLKSMKTARANKFAEAWVLGVETAIKNFILHSEEEYEELRSIVIASSNVVVKTCAASKSDSAKKAKKYLDNNAGYIQGKKVKIHRGINGVNDQHMLF